MPMVGLCPPEQDSAPPISLQSAHKSQQATDGARYLVGDVDVKFATARDGKRRNGREAQMQLTHARDTLSSHRIRRSSNVQSFEFIQHCR